jgi:hypothetical protein
MWSTEGQVAYICYMKENRAHTYTFCSVYMSWTCRKHLTYYFLSTSWILYLRVGILTSQLVLRFARWFLYLRVGNILELVLFLVGVDKPLILYSS